MVIKAIKVCLSKDLKADRLDFLAELGCLDIVSIFLDIADVPVWLREHAHQYAQ